MAKPLKKYFTIAGICFAAGAASAQIERLGGPSPGLDNTVQWVAGAGATLFGAQQGFDLGLYWDQDWGMEQNTGTSRVKMGMKNAGFGAVVGGGCYIAGNLMAKYFQ